MRENITLPSLDRDSTRGFIDRDAEAAQRVAMDRRRSTSDRDDPERLYALLSGGNQQKVVFGKWLSFAPKVMVIEDPTSGVDVGARQAIYDLIRQQAAAGVSFVVCSSDHRRPPGDLRPHPRPRRGPRREELSGEPTSKRRASDGDGAAVSRRRPPPRGRSSR